MKEIIRKGSRAEAKLRNISEDLQKKIETGRIGKLSLFGIKSSLEIGKELVAKGVSETFLKDVADYFQSFGFLVTMDFNKTSYVIVA